MAALSTRCITVHCQQLSSPNYKY